ncbi:phosphatase PAP2 family protein [Deminuibacter soli]|uniref:PAP2 family protein n=1 Tax=Deminuibacter soli TaxID=2291815 RepID=A0A3E1NM97_9BACT|nr:phosphatase PAP2 family protein [Deminuibacter soli]RFM29049.1 PAP2 family protein [Deminuibacter soli]
MLCFKKTALIAAFVPVFYFFSVRAGAQGWDLNLAKSINPQNPGSSFWKGATSSVYPVAIAIPFGQLAVGLIGHDKLTLHRAYETFGSILVSTAISQVLKSSINRQRPGEKHPDEIFPYKQEHGKSFPSGHTTLAFAAATSLALEYKKWYVVVPAYIWAGCAGYSRIYLGEHYPSDVIGGAVTGAGSALLSHWLTKKLLKR